MLTKPLASYSHTKKIGNLVFVAGQGCRNPETNDYVGLTKDSTGKITCYDIVAQAAGVLNNIELALKQIGLDRRHIVDVTVFLTNMADFPNMNAVWNEFFKELTPPTRTTVCVTQLPGDNFIEMKAIATTTTETD